MEKIVIIITLNYNQNNYTIHCINSLLESDYENFKILLVDNGSTEENYNCLKNQLGKEPKIILKRLVKNCGYVGGINFGLREGSKYNPDYFLIINNDTIIDKYSISVLVYTCRNFQNKAIVSGKVYHYNEPNKLQYGGMALTNKNKLRFEAFGVNEIDKGQYDSLEQRDWLDDTFWLFPYDLYNMIGEYSEYFWFNAEQADFALRAQSVGYSLIYTPDAKIWHKGSASIGGRNKNPKRAYWHVQSTLIFRFIHLSKKYFLIEYLTILKGIITTYAKSILKKLKGHPSELDYAKAKWLGFIYFNKWLLKRNKNDGYNPFDELNK